MENLLAKGTDWLIGKVHEIETMAAATRTKILAVETRIKALQVREARIADPKKRADAHRANAQLWTVVDSVRKAYDKAASMYADAKSKAVVFLRSKGLLKGTGLGELGIAPIVALPLAIAAAIAGSFIAIKAASAFAHQAELQATARERKQAKDEKIDADQAAGRITAEQAAKLRAENQKQFEQETRAAQQGTPPVDPLGLTAMFEAATPLVLILAGIVLVPRLLDTFNASRGHGYVSNPRRRRPRRRSRAWVVR